MAHLPTIKIKDKRYGHSYLINEADFDPAIHERVRARLSRAADDPDTSPAEEEIEDDGDDGSQDDGLLALDASALRALADELGVSKAVSRRETLIDKIREARAASDADE